MNDSDRQPEQKTMNYNNPMQPKICHLEIQLDINLHQKTISSSKSPSTSPSTNTTNTAPTNDRSIIGSILTLLCFLISSGFIYFLFVFIDIHLANPQQTNSVEQSNWNNRWWSYGRLQSLFICGVGCTTAEVSLRCARNNRKTRFIDRVALDICAILFISVLILQFAAPETYRIELNATKLPIDRGECVDPTTIDSYFQEICPSFHENELIAASSTLNAWSKNASVSSKTILVTGLAFVEKMHQLEAILAQLGTGSGSFAGHDKRYVAAKFLTEDPTCVKSMVDSTCEAMFVRCRQSDCSLLPSLCFNYMDAAYDTWKKCAINKCEKNGIVDGVDVAVDRSCEIGDDIILKFIADYRIEMTKPQNSGLIDRNELELVLALLNRLQLTAERSDTTKITKYTSNTSTVCEWKNQSSLSSNDHLNCNINVTTYKHSEIRFYNDQKHVLATTGVVLSFLVLSSCHSPTIPNVSIFQLLSSSLGMVVSLTLFVNGLNLERSGEIEPNVKYQMLLNIWSSLYLFVSWLCLNHSLFLLFPTDEGEHKHRKKHHNCILIRSIFTKEKKYICKSKKIKITKREEEEEQKVPPPPPSPSPSPSSPNVSPSPSSPNLLRKRSSQVILVANKSVSFLVYTKKECLSSNGKWFMVVLLLKEVAESAFQLAGVISTAPETASKVVFGVSFCIGMNLIVLPITNLSMRYFFGPVVALGACIVIETAFDKALMLLNVFARDNKVTNDVTIPILEQILRHGITLLPAISFARNKAKFVKIYNLWKTNEHRTKPKSERIVGQIVCIFSPISIFLGLSLVIFITNQYYTQRSICFNEIGPIVDCMEPSLYFSNGFFKQTTCAFEYVQSFECSNNSALMNVKKLPESIRYSEMTALKKINMSLNPSLTTVPKSFQFIPTLQSLDLSYTGLVHLPYAVCSGSSYASLTSLDLTGTKASRSLDWTGEIYEMNQSSFILSSGCKNALKDTLNELILADNQLECPFASIPYQADPFWGVVANESQFIYHDAKKVDTTKRNQMCTFSIVSELTQLGFLDLTNNSITSIRSELTKLSINNQLLNSSNKGVVLKNNPIQTIEMKSLMDKEAKMWLKFISQTDLSSVTLLEMFAIKIDQTYVFSIIKEMKNIQVINTDLNQWSALPISNNNVKLLRVEHLEFVYVLNQKFMEGYENVEYLQLEDMQSLHVIESNVFQHTNKLKVVVLSCKKQDTSSKFNIFKTGTFVKPTLQSILIRDCQNFEISLEKNIFHPNVLRIAIRNSNGLNIDSNPFHGLVNLEWLEIWDTNLKNLHSDVFVDLIQLESLRLVNGHITLPINIFSTLKNLKNLMYTDHDLTNFPDYLFQDLIKLEELNLVRDKIQKITNHTFSGLTSLRSLWLSENNIGSISTGSFSGLTNLMYLNLCRNNNNLGLKKNDKGRVLIGGAEWCDSPDMGSACEFQRCAFINT